MFLKSLTITSETRTIRKITFQKGVNLIVDETPNQKDVETGNGVGKTSVLKLIDFCLGADGKILYTDTEDRKKIYKEVRDFLLNKGIVITLILTADLEDRASKEIKIERNFLSRKSKIQRIDGIEYNERDFDQKLLELLFPNQTSDKPTLRQIISHNMRYTDDSVNFTIKTLGRFASPSVYETLVLYLVGSPFDAGKLKLELQEKIKQETNFRAKLSDGHARENYETVLTQIDSEIARLNRSRNRFTIDENFEVDFMKLQNLQREIGRLGSKIARNSIKRDLIIEAREEMNARRSTLDLNQLAILYSQATNAVQGIQRTFEDLVAYHNEMILQKVEYIIQDLPEIESSLAKDSSNLRKLVILERRLGHLLSNSKSFAELESEVFAFGNLSRRKGEMEAVIAQLVSVESRLETLNSQLEGIETEMFSEAFRAKVKTQIGKFNVYYSRISNTLYGEDYALTPDVITNSKGQRHYEFSTLDTKNFSSGQKQGETSCFDIAYILFADNENLPCLHFLLSDKKELMHDNQLAKIAEFVNDNNLQFVFSILKDKLPDSLNKEENIVVKLSQNDKLFRIESDLSDANLVANS